MRPHPALRTGVLLPGMLAAAPLALALSIAKLPLGGMDADHDGALTPAEHAAGAHAMFVTMDADRDGNVTADEMTAAQDAIHRGEAGAGPGSKEKIAVVDADGDGRVSAAEHARGSERMFARMDRDADGRLTPAEFDAGHAALQRRGPEGN
jgi:hypothetical protein